MQLNVIGTRDFDLVAAAERLERGGAELGLVLRQSKLELYWQIDRLHVLQLETIFDEDEAEDRANRILCGKLTVPPGDDWVTVMNAQEEILWVLRRQIPELERLEVATAPPEQLARELRAADVTPREWNGLWFRSYTEQQIAQALDRANVFFVPNPTARLGVTQDHRVTREPDFLVVCDGKVGILEVNGPFGHGPDDDHERARLFKEHGIGVIEHFRWEECHEMPDDVVERFLRLLRLNG
jgi:hypothetical protein